jgi:hypothetical protein
MKITVPDILSGCPMGGEHESGQSGEWIGKCRKCGQPC